MYVIDTISDEKYFIVKKGEKEICRIAKSVNTINDVLTLVGKENVIVK